MTDIRTQYRIIESGAGWIERARRGRLRFTGKDRVPFLQALVTNDLAVVGPERGAYAVYLTPQGRLITDLRLYERGDGLIADVPVGVTGDLVARFDGLIFAEDVAVSNVSAAIAHVGVMGARAAALLTRALDVDAARLDALPVLGVVDAGSAFIARTDEGDGPVFDVLMPAADRDVILAKLAAVGIEPVSDAMAEVLRIEAGRPAFGQDMDGQTIPLEAGLLERAISLTKGCYVGQEVIVRVLHRGGGRVAKRLVKLTFDPDVEAAPAAGTVLSIDGHDVGRITSAAWSPRLGRVVALGYLARESAEPGRRVVASAAGGDASADVLALAG